GDVSLAGPQHGRPGGAFGDAPHDQALDVRDVAPIPGVGFEHDLYAGGVAHEFVGAGADRVFAEAVVADLGEVFLRNDDAGGRGGRSVEGHEVRPRVLELKADRERIDDVDLADASQEFLGAGAAIALEAELYVLGGQGIAVVELEPTAQLELVGQPVSAFRPRLGEAVAHLVAGQRAHHRVVDGIEHSEGRDLRWRGRRIEPRRGDRDVPGHDGLAGLGGVASADLAQERGGDREQHERPNTLEVHGSSDQLTYS